MNANPLIYGLVLAALAGAAFRYLPDEGSKTPHAHSAPEVRSQNDHRRRTDHPGTDGRHRTAGENAIPVRKPDSRAPTASRRSAKHLTIDPAHGSDRERRIRERLAHPDPDERIATLQDVYGLEDQDAVPLLHEVLLREKDGTVHQEAAEALANIAGDAAVSMVTTALGDQDVAVRGRAIEALGLVGMHGHSLLGQVLLGDPEPALRLRALQLLAADGGPAAMALLQAAVDDADPAISGAARDTLRSQPVIPTADAIDRFYSSGTGLPVDPENPLLGLSRSNHPDERIEAIRNLRFIDEEDALRTLRAVLEHDEDVSVREEALFALDDIGGETAVSVMSAALGDDSPALRRRAIETLWSSGSSDAFPLLGQVLFGDPDPDLRLEAVRLLGAESGSTARALLIAARADPDQRVSEYADQLLARRQ